MKLQIGTEQVQLEYAAVNANGKPENTVQLHGQNGAAWQHTLTSTTTATPVLLLPTGGKQVFIAYGFDLLALDTHTGHVQWQQHFDEPIWTGQLMIDGQLLLQLELSIVRLDAQGDSCWRYNHGEIITDVSVQDGHLYIHDFTGHELVLDLETGRLSNVQHEPASD
jgi:outer membrane protein assembly factor BamB